MRLSPLFESLADVLDGSLEIESVGRAALLTASQQDVVSTSETFLPSIYQQVFREHDAHPVCAVIAATPFDWSPPQTSKDPDYVADSVGKVHVELIGPDGLVPSTQVRMGLYGMLPGYEYGIRTHLAEEVFVMLAGEADWKRGDGPYIPCRRGKRVYHPSMLPHATRTRDNAFLSLYIWRGDVSTDSYRYHGKPD